MKALLIQPDGAAVVADVKPDYPDINNTLGFQWMEALHFEDATFIFDEEGKLNGQPRNVMATDLLFALGHQLFPGDYLAGPVAVFGPLEGDEVTDVTAEVIGEIARLVQS